MENKEERGAMKTKKNPVNFSTTTQKNEKQKKRHSLG